MQAIDHYTIKTIGIPEIILMENAARSVVDVILEESPKHVTIFCGMGNNGGDGFAIARLLYQRTIEPTIVLIGSKKQLKGDALVNFDILVQLKLCIKEITHIEQLDEVYTMAINQDCLVDALFGTGLSRDIEGLYLEAINMMNQLEAPIISVDIPSGVDADTGNIYGTAVKADKTVTFCCPKIGLLLYPGADYAGDVKIKDIGIPQQSVNRIAPKVQVITEKIPCLPKRINDSHKGTFGKLLLIAGSADMPGAAILSSLAAYRSGVGLVKVFCDERIRSSIASKVPEVVYASYIGEQEVLADKDYDQLIGALQWADAVAIGPGLGQSNVSLELLRTVLEVSNDPVLIDADGLNLLSSHTHLLENRKMPTIITPHLGEMARLCNTSIESIKKDVISISKKFSITYGCISVVKSSRTIITNNKGDVFINPYGNSGMATAGSGDVLTGIISSLIAQSIILEDAVLLGVYIHSKAGDLVKDKFGAYGLIASDIIDEIPNVMKPSLVE